MSSGLEAKALVENLAGYGPKRDGGFVYYASFRNVISPGHKASEDAITAASKSFFYTSVRELFEICCYGIIPPPTIPGP